MTIGEIAVEYLCGELCDDAISRRAVLKLFATHDGKYLFEAIRDLPSVTPKQTEITLESAIDYLHRIGWMQKHDKELTEGVGQEPKTGRWIQATRPFNFRFKCSECGRPALKNGRNGNDVKSKYCPRCGARMESEEQAEKER